MFVSYLIFNNNISPFNGFVGTPERTLVRWDLKAIPNNSSLGSDIKSKLKIYDTWKGRFVLQTTGPRSFKRFITLYKNPQLKYVEINSLITPADLENTKKNIYKYPFITLQTSSWLESVGTSKGDKIVKQKYRDELFGKDFF